MYFFLSNSLHSLLIYYIFFTKECKMNSLYVKAYPCERQTLVKNTKLLNFFSLFLKFRITSSGSSTFYDFICPHLAFKTILSFKLRIESSKTQTSRNIKKEIIKKAKSKFFSGSSKTNDSLSNNIL